MYAYQAHKIDPDAHEAIVAIVKQYANEQNINRKRTEDSLLVEWKEHNRYSFKERAQNVVFNEKEEGKSALCFFKSNMCWFRKRVSVRFSIPKEFYKRNA